MVRAVTWNATAKWTTQIFSWVSSILVARLLSPSDYGIFGMVALYDHLAGVIADAGISDAVVMLRDLSCYQIAALNTLAVLLGVALFGLSCAVSLPLAHFFATPQLRSVVMVTGIQFLIVGFQIVPKSLLRKELRFKLLAWMDTFRFFCQMSATLVFAWLGWGYWSLVGSFVFACAVGTGLTLYFRRHSFARPRFSQLRGELRFSTHLLFSRVAWYSYENSDFLIAGRVLGQVPLGNYTIAWTISSAPVEKISSLIGAVAPAYFSAVQKDHAELRRYLLRLTEALSYLTVPASIGLALTADSLVPVLLGPKWVGVVAPLRFLSLYIAARSISTLLPHLLNAIGASRFVMRTMGFSAFGMPMAFLVGSRWGAQGIAAAWAVMYPAITFPLCYAISKRTGLRLRDYVYSVTPAFGASLVMVCVVLLTRWMLPATVGQPFRLALLVGAGMLAYLGALFSVFRKRVVSLVGAVVRTRRREILQGPCDECSRPEKMSAGIDSATICSTRDDIGCDVDNLSDDKRPLSGVAPSPGQVQRVLR